MPLVLWMEAISIAHLQHLSEQFLGTGRASYLKIVYLLVTLVFILFILLLDGKVQQQMHVFMKMLKIMTYIFQLASTTLQMQAIHYLLNS